MNTATISLLVTCCFCSTSIAQSQFTNELERLTKQRDKAVAEATAPIQKKYEGLLGQLLKRATQAGDLDAAIKIKAAIQTANEQQGKNPPEAQNFDKQIAGRWDGKSSSGFKAIYIFKEDGTWMALQNGVIIASDNKWKKVGNSLKVIHQNGSFDEYKLPIIDGKLIGKSLANNTLNLTKLPPE